jgi:hypothetical protein
VVARAEAVGGQAPPADPAACVVSCWFTEINSLFGTCPFTCDDKSCNASDCGTCGAWTCETCQGETCDSACVATCRTGGDICCA